LLADATEPEQCRAGSRMRKPSGVTPGRLFSVDHLADPIEAPSRSLRRSVTFGSRAPFWPAVELPACLYERTSSDRPGMSQNCQREVAAHSPHRRV